MNFELSPKEYWKSLNQSEIQLYCFSLNIDGKIGWRLPTYEELNKLLASNIVSIGLAGWHQNDIHDQRFKLTEEMYCYPVRDLS